MGGVNDLVLVQGLRDTRGALERWNANPWSVLKAWGGGALMVASVLLFSVWVVASVAPVDLTAALHPRASTGGADPGDVAEILLRNSLVLALHAFACVAGFIAGSSLPLAAEQRRGLSRWVHEKARPIALAWVVIVTCFSLITQAYVLGSPAPARRPARDLAGPARAHRAPARASRAGGAVPALWPPGRSPAAATSGTSCSRPPSRPSRSRSRSWSRARAGRPTSGPRSSQLVSPIVVTRVQVELSPAAASPSLAEQGAAEDPLLLVEEEAPEVPALEHGPALRLEDRGRGRPGDPPGELERPRDHVARRRPRGRSPSFCASVASTMRPVRHSSWATVAGSTARAAA